MATAAPSNAAPAIATRHVPTRIRLAHGLGSIAYGVKDNGFSVFLLTFYNQVLGLDAGLVGTAIMAALIFDAFIDPLIGHWSDQTRSRWGRRLPWLYAAAVPLTLAWFALWHPPLEASPATQLAWLFASAVVVRTLVSCCEVPSIALVPEMTSDYDQRTLLMRFRFLFGWSGGLLLLILAYAVFFAQDADGNGGVTEAAGYDRYALFGALLMGAATLTSALGQHRWLMRNCPPKLQAAERHGWRQMRATIANRAFLILLAAALFSFINQGITFALTNYLLGFVWQMSSAQMTVYALLLLVSIVSAFFLIGPIQRHWGKRRGAIMCGMVTLAGNSLLYTAYAAGLTFAADGTPQVPALFATVLVANTSGIMLMIFSASMVADVVEDSEQETGRRAEGLFYAGYFFIQKCATGVGIFLAGQLLSLAQFPDGARPEAVAGEVLSRIALGYAAIILVLGCIGLLILRQFPIDRDAHRARLAALAHQPENAHAAPGKDSRVSDNQ